MELTIPAGERKEIILIHDTPENTKQVIRLAGEGAEVHINEIFISADVQSNLEVIHDARNTVSRIHSRGIAGKLTSAHAKVIIPKHAQLSDTFVSQDFLVLDKNAKIDAVPSLEIEADEVKAAHSATISPLDPEKIFYMTSRGMPEKQARDMIIEGFLKLPKGYEHLLEKW